MFTAISNCILIKNITAMEVLKLLKPAVVAILLFSNLSFCSIPTDDQYIEVYFSDKLNINDLAKIETEMAERNIKLTYNYLRFNDKGKLKEIDYYVWYKRSGGGDKITDTHKENGFIINIDPDPKAKYDVIVGDKDRIQQWRISLEKKKDQ